jgi:predicted NUDIX family NTP pyrophosphohydrolase
LGVSVQGSAGFPACCIAGFQTRSARSTQPKVGDTASSKACATGSGKSKDSGAWTIPQGKIQPGKDALAAAKREFEEELAFKPEGPFLKLTPIRQKSGKVVRAWAFVGDCDPAHIHSNTFSIEWSPHSGRTATFPEVDRANFFTLKQAEDKINPAQTPLLEEAQQSISNH